MHKENRFASLTATMRMMKDAVSRVDDNVPMKEEEACNWAYIHQQAMRIERWALDIRALAMDGMNADKPPFECDCCEHPKAGLAGDCRAEGLGNAAAKGGQS